MDDDAQQALQNLLADRADQPFGDVELVSNRTRQPFSLASQEGASNLLAKSLRAVNQGDLDRARKLVEQAARMPYDEHEETAPVAFAVRMQLFELVVDALEASEADDSRWLEAAIEVLADSDAAARYEFRDVLTDIDQDYRLLRTESSRLRAAVAPIPKRAALRDLDLDPTELSDHVLSILTACSRYQAGISAPGR